MKSQPRTNSNIWRLIKLGQSSLIFMVGSAFVGAIVEGMTLSFFVPVLLGGKNAMMETAGEAGKFIRQLNEWGLFTSTESILACLVTATCVRGLIEFFRLYYQSQVSFDIGERIRINALKSLGSTSYVRFLEFTKGDLVNFFNTEISSCINGLSKLAQTIALAFSSIALVAISFLVNPPFTVLAILLAVFLGLFFKSSHQWLINYSRANSQRSGDFHGLLLQTLHFFKYLMSTERFNTLEKRVMVALNILLSNKRRYSRRSAFITSIQEPIAVIALVAIILIETRFKGTPLPTLMVSLLVFYRVMKSLNGLQLSWQGYLATTGSVEIVLGTLEKLDQSAERSPVQLPPPVFKKDIVLETISLELGGQKILKQLSLTIPKFSTIAIVGESGAGKTTVVDLLTGLLVPMNGRILIDGVDLKEVSLKDWRRQIGLVTQEPVSFGGTVKENIAFWSASPDETALESIILKSGARDFLDQRPGRLDAQMGDNGVNFSGGQRQRIAIARELYRKPELLILDEATSALDAENEDLIQQSLLEMKGQLTIVMVTHRLASVRSADKIFVMDKGQIIQSGNFKELYSANDSRFRAMCDRQGVQPLS